MKILKHFIIVFLLFSFFSNSVIETDATDSPDQNESETDPHTERDGLLYANGGTWIQGADGRWWYRHSDGSYTTSDWEYINGKWYYFDSEGWMVTGWIQLGSTWYYLKPSSGEMVTNWQLIDGYWYYFNSSGAMYTGWLYDTNTYKHFYLDSNGHMVIGWKQISRPGYYNGDIYWNYFDDTGMFVTDSDVHGCGSGYSTFLDHKHLKGTSLNYYVSSGNSYVNQINSAAAYWNNTSDHTVSLTRNTTGLQPIDILFYNDSSIEGYGITYHFNSSGLQISPMNGNWNRCEVALKNNNNNPLSTVCHELGHVFGLSHRIAKTDSIMQIYHDYRTVSTPQQCDINVLNHLY